MSEPAPYREAKPRAVWSLMTGLALAAGERQAAELYLARLQTVLAVPRVPAEVRR